MTTLHRAARMDQLVQALGDVVERPLASPFTKEIIVVPARGLEPWLAMELAKRFGVWANPSFPSPSAWMNELAAAVLGVQADSPYESGGTVAYALAALIPGELGRASFAPLAAYLEDDRDGSKRLPLAHRIAATFRSYLLHRPEWIRAAETGRGGQDGQGWQVELWAKLVERLGRDHLVRRTDALLARLASGDHAALPERICVFGTRGLAAMHLDVLAAVAGRAEVHLFELASPVHPLERSLGRLGREAHAALVSRFTLEIDEPAATPGGATVPLTGASLSVHACHGAMRECEVLRDQILAILTEQPELEPHDIRVLCPDLASYAPLVHAVFDLPREDPRWLPYRVDGESTDSSLPVAGAFLALIDLLPTRLAASQVMDVLALEPVRARFGLNAGDLDRVQTWLTESGIRWGADEAHRGNEGQPALRDNTWAFGLDRLLLGYAMSPNDRHLFAGTLPFDDVEGSSARALGGFADFCEKLFAARRAVQAPADAAGWQERLAAILEALVGSTFETEYQHRIVRQALADEVEAATVAGFTDPLPLGTVAAHLGTRLAGRGRAGGYTCGGVTFVPFAAGRVVPSPVVALLGMNLGSFPRVARPIGFDLLARAPRPGDPAPRDEDRQLFLDVLGAATEQLVITYDGHSVKNNAERPPSVVVSELLEVVSAEKGFVVHHPLHPFSPRYFGAEEDARLFSHSQTLCDGAQAMRGDREARAHFFVAPLPPEERAAVSLDDLAKFFANPIEALCRNRLGLALRKDAASLEDREPLDFGGLERWKIGSPLLERALRGERFDLLPPDVRAGGALPLGVVAEPEWEEVRITVANLTRAIQPHLATCRSTPLTIDLELEATRLHGSLRHAGSKGHLYYRYGQLRGEHKMLAWVRHLAFLASSPDDAPTTWVFGRAKGLEATAFHFSRVRDPEQQLANLVELHALGMRAPLPAFADAAFAYLEAEDAKKPPLAAASATFRGMFGLHSDQGEGNAYVKLVWGAHGELDPPKVFADLPVPTFVQLVDRVYRPAFAHMKAGE